MCRKPRNFPPRSGRCVGPDRGGTVVQDPEDVVGQGGGAAEGAEAEGVLGSVTLAVHDDLVHGVEKADGRVRGWEDENLNLRISLKTVSKGVLVRVLVDADPAGFDDPEVASDRWLQTRDQRSDGVLEILRRRLGRQSQHGDARVVCRSITKWVTELKIEGNETPLLVQRSLDDPVVAGRAEVLLVDCRDIVAGSFKESTRQTPKVLVELESQ